MPAAFLLNARLFGLPGEAREIVVRARVASTHAVAAPTVLDAVGERVAIFAPSDVAALNPKRPCHVRSLGDYVAQARKEPCRAK